MTSNSLRREFARATEGNRSAIDALPDPLSDLSLDNIDKGQAIAVVAAQIAQVSAQQSQALQQDVVQKKPMPENVWNTLYAIRNGQMTELYSLKSDTGINKIRKEALMLGYYGYGSSMSPTDIIAPRDGNSYQMRTHNGWQKRKIQSWGDFVEFCVERQLDLSGLALSPEQRGHLFEFELQNKSLKRAKMDYSVLDGIDLTGTDFNEARLNHASLKNTTGTRPNFTSVKGHKLDLSHASYTSPVFTDMNAPWSVHFRSTYDNPRIESTNWENARLAATKLIVGNAQGLFMLSGAFAPGLLIYGTGAGIAQPQLSYSKITAPGSCFFNIAMVGGIKSCEKGDFSPLLLKDPRLSDEERAYFASFGQWLNSAHAMDGVKVSPEVELSLDPNRIFSMFSEVTFKANNVTPDTMFFSKGQVIARKGFHEASVADLPDLLPEILAKNVKNPDVPVIVAKAESGEGVSQPTGKTSRIPKIDFDKDQIDLQVEALKKASIAEAMGLGIAAQRSFSEASTIVTDWAMEKLAHKPGLATKIGEMIADIESYTINPPVAPPPPVVVAPPPPPPPPIPEKPKGGFFSGFFKGLSGDDHFDDEPRHLRPLVLPPSPPKAPPPEDIFNTRIRKDLEKFPDAVSAAIKDSEELIGDVEDMKTYLETLQGAITDYVSGIENVMPEIEATNPRIKGVVTKRAQSMMSSHDILGQLYQNVDALMESTINSGSAVQWVQGVTIPDLNGHFSKAAGLHDLHTALGKNAEGYRRDPRLEGLYNVSVTPGTDQSPKEQVGAAFGRAQSQIVLKLKEVHKAMDEVDAAGMDILKNILNPGSRPSGNQLTASP